MSRVALDTELPCSIDGCVPLRCWWDSMPPELACHTATYAFVPSLRDSGSLSTVACPHPSHMSTTHLWSSRVPDPN
eukprot:scaffold577_cov405-Prasinococcus_capsulatus_cf.AAC.18